MPMNQSAGVTYPARGYFMTKEAEDAAKWNAVEQLQKVKARLLALKTEMSRIGKEWVSFGSAMQHPEDYVFEVTSAAVTLGKSDAGLRRPLGRITPEDALDWEKFSALLNEYREAMKEEARLSANLHDAGFPTK
jgi:hypothetical protein